MFCQLPASLGTRENGASCNNHAIGLKKRMMSTLCRVKTKAEIVDLQTIRRQRLWDKHEHLNSQGSLITGSLNE